MIRQALETLPFLQPVAARRAFFGYSVLRRPFGFSSWGKRFVWSLPLYPGGPGDRPFSSGMRKSEWSDNYSTTATWALSLGERGGSTKRRIRRFLALGLEEGLKTPTRRRPGWPGWGRACGPASRQGRWRLHTTWPDLRTATTSQREMTSRAVNCLRWMPGRGRRSLVSTSTISPGSRAT